MTLSAGTAGEKTMEKPEKIKNPLYWVVMEKLDGYAYSSDNGLTVIQSIAIEDDGRRWMHTSFSRRSRVPDYKDIMKVKRDFIGENKKAIMIFPEKKNHVNIMPYCLHLFTCLDEDGIPEFSKAGLL